MAMAAAIGIGLGYSKRPFAVCPPLIYCVAKLPRIGFVSAVESPKVDDEHPTLSKSTPNPPVNGSGRVQYKADEWKTLSSKQLGITNSMIDKQTQYVLKNLKNKGYEVYLVGGCVRDLILKRIPKDFDVITSAELREVVRSFPRCEIVGRRFPICHVHVADTIIEVSSFSTVAKKPRKNSDHLLKRPRGSDEQDYIRWRNCIQRDFTINGLMFDPFSKLVYDYIGGIEDIKKSRVRTVIPAFSSFTEDCARILRAFRIAARLEFKFTKELALSLKDLSYSLLRLDKGRIFMEMNYMLAYGSAEASLRLLWKYGLLEMLLPIQSLFSNLDKLLAPDRPCHSCLWVCLLAFHKALADQPRDPLVVAAFCLAVHNGGSLPEAINIAKSITRPHDSSFFELLEDQNQKMGENLVKGVKDLAAAVKTALCQMTDETVVSQAMAKYPQAPFSDMVFISLALQLRTERIIICVTKGREKGFAPKHGTKINYESLAMGSMHEVRYMLSRIIFDTIYPLNKNRNKNDKHATGN